MHSFRLQHPKGVHSPPCSLSTQVMKTLTGNTITLEGLLMPNSKTDALFQTTTPKRSPLSTLFFVHTGHEDPDWQHYHPRGSFDAKLKDGRTLSDYNTQKES